MDTTCGSWKQPKLLLTAVWPTERFQQLDSIRGFLKGGRPHPHCASHFLTHIQSWIMDEKKKNGSRSHTSMEAVLTFELSLHGAEHHTHSTTQKETSDKNCCAVFNMSDRIKQS